jgi:hypothetical protein
MDDIENRDLNIKNSFYFKYKKVGRNNKSGITTQSNNAVSE